MKFCKSCNNLLYLNLKNKELWQECKICDYKEKIDENIDSVYKKYYTKDQLTKSFAINKYTHLDPTLPRIRGKKCINNSCITNKNLNLYEIKYISLTDLQSEMNDTSIKEEIIFDKTTNHYIATINKSVSGANKIRVDKNGNEYICKPYHNDIVYIKYDEENMKYIYICCACQTSWKTN